MDLKKLLYSFRYALEGIIFTFREQNMRVHFIIACIVIIASIFTRISLVEWMIVIIVIFLVLSAEMVNTAIERVVDLASPEIHPLAKQAKDIAAGVVLVIACMSVIIGVLIFLPKWL